MTLGRASCGSTDEACRREWLVTNGLGGYACGTVGGINTRRYHGFLIASLEPPVRRMLLVAKIEVSIRYLGRLYHLSANEFVGGAVDPRGFIHIESFALADGIPTWRFALADAVLEQRIFMAPHTQTSYLSITVLRASGPLGLELKPLIACRDHHHDGRGARAFEVTAQGERCAVGAGAAGPCVGIEAAGARFKALDEWYWNFLHREELARGLESREDLYAPGIFEVELGAASEPFVLAASLEAAPARAPAAAPAAASAASAASAALGALTARTRQLRESLPASAPAWVQMLATASDQFIVRRGTAAGTSTVIAGYPWFADWGRDAMISLPGLTTLLGRHDTAREILRVFAGFIEGGMLPNRFPDEGTAPEYNTADATLWFFHALDAHLGASSDTELARELVPTLKGIIEAHVAGTRYGIHVDAKDGLLHAGEPGVQLTWMDAKQGDHVFTPRRGKPVEINALWLNALDVTARIATRVRNAPLKRRCTGLLEQGRASFARFWNEGQGCLFDVLDAEPGALPDAHIRPNQIFAVSLPYSALKPAQMRGVLERCARELLTSYGLRSLSPADPDYCGRYEGNVWERDAAYHQGTAWSWLLGPFALAHHRVHGDARAAQALLEPIAQHLTEEGCVGSVSEIFDGDAPHRARGCFAQAWGVAEVLRAWLVLEAAAAPPSAGSAAPKRAKSTRAAPPPRAGGRIQADKSQAPR